MATSNPGRDETIMVETKDIDRILDKLNNDVIPMLTALDKRLSIVETMLEERKRNQAKEDTERLDLLKVHDRILRGDGNSPGLIAQVSDLQDWVNTRSGYEKIFITGLIAQGLGTAVLVLKIVFGI